ncbi:hypothetical protein DGo_PC0108 (plasmid) [Deinococcus gobiensis I-0]|uniref:Uncharacterized protein n=2 Tax=Deinococcus TaxID=1298 RepID=H8H303_DEIGI|nr:hypothetical protein DGo_PC0108 [Deinococcus gobiensis I-0]
MTLQLLTMTKHLFTSTTATGERRYVDTGYDWMCGHFFLLVTDTDREEPDADLMVYFTAHDPRFLDRNRKGSAFGGATLDELKTCFEEQGITPPEGLFEKLRDDELLQRSHEITHW